MTERTGGEILADALIANGGETVFCVPGESYLPFLDACHDRGNALRLVTCRQEGGAAYMAEAWGKLTGRPGLCFATRGPGACNAAIGVHVAFQDSTPMILMLGQVERAFLGREAFQEVDFRQMFGPLAKHVEEVGSADKIPEVMARAYAIATGGRPGPVVVVFPEDVLFDTAVVDDVAVPWPPVQAHPGAEQLAGMSSLLAQAKRPLAIVGGGGWTAEAASAFTAWAEKAGLPVAASFRCQDMVDNLSPVYVGELGTSVAPSLARRVKEADLLLVVGARLGEMTTQGYTLVEAPQPCQTLIHVYPAGEELGRVFRPALGILAGPAAFAAALAAVTPPDPAPWRAWAEAVRADYLAGLQPDPCPGAVDLGQVMKVLAERLPEDAILTMGAGNFTGWPQRFWRYRHFRTQLGPANGSMGYGLPAAVAAKLARPERMVVCFTGDGDFLMNGQELATAAMQGAAPLVLVFDNGTYGTIRMHQERTYPGRVSGSDLRNPDFAAFARSFGAHAETVAETAEFAPALDRAMAAGKLALIVLKVDPDAISTRATLSGIRAKALKQREERKP